MFIEALFKMIKMETIQMSINKRLNKSVMFIQWKVTQQYKRPTDTYRDMRESQNRLSKITLITRECI